MRFKKIMLNNLSKLTKVEGDFAEFGVFKGGTFIKLLPIAKNQGKVLHGFDSFRGLAKPSKFDVNKEGKTAYHEGKFNTYGCRNIVRNLTNQGYTRNKEYYLWEGFIPDTFELVPVDIKFSFCYIDLDHYLPTKHTLEWIFPKLSIGGLILCDDYYTTKTKGSASKAINDFMKENKDNLQIIENAKWVNYSWAAGQIALRKIK